MPVEYIPRIQEKYAQEGYPSYRWVTNTQAPPWQPLRQPLTQCRLGLVASGGIYWTGQVAFHYKDDVSWRVIPTDVPTADLRLTHFAYDLTDARHGQAVQARARGLMGNSAAVGGAPDQAGQCGRSRRVAALRVAGERADPAPCLGRHPARRNFTSGL